jgi:hypothetical protein
MLKTQYILDFALKKKLKIGPLFKKKYLIVDGQPKLG